MNLVFLKRKLLLSPRRTKQVIIAFTDFSLFFLVSFIALSISQQAFLGINYIHLLEIVWIPFLGIIVFSAFGVYRSIVRYMEFSTILRIVWLISLVFLIDLILRLYFFENLKVISSFSNLRIAVI